MAKKIKNELQDIIDGEISPQQKLQQYRKSQSKIGADAVRKGREKFAKDYIEPIIKTGATAFGLASGNPLTLNTLFAPRTLAMLAGNTTLGYYMNKENDPYLEAATSVTGNIVKPQLNEQLKRTGGINDFLQAKEEFSKGNIGKGIFNTATGIGGVYDSDWIPGRYDDYIDKALELLNVTGDLNDSYNAYKKYSKNFEDGGALQKIAGYHPVVAGAKKLMSNFAENVNPFFYGNAVKRVIDAALLNKKSEGRIWEEQDPSIDSKERIDLLQLLANKSQKYNSILKSDYKPSKGNNKKTNYYKSLSAEEELQNYIDTHWEAKPILSKKDIPTKGESSLSRMGSLGNVTLDYGTDEKGNYISYYDKWDLNPVPQTGINWIDKAVDKVVTGVPNALGITNTPEVYGRVYLPEKKNGGELFGDGSGEDNSRLMFLGGLTGATAMTGGADIAGKVSEFIPTNTKGGGAASGALKGASMGSSLGVYGMAAGALIGGAAGLIGAENAQNKQAFSDSINSMKERNQMLGIKANGGYIVPLGVSPNMTSQYEDGGMLTEFNNGGSHEQSPYQGIPQGVAPDGQTNKVEEGETKWQDYIFSDRLLLDKNTVEQHNLPKSMIGKTFAEASKKMSKLYKERPNDPISRNTQKDYMQHLMMANDESRAFEESSLMAGGGHLYDKGSRLFKKAIKEDSDSPLEIEGWMKDQSLFGGNNNNNISALDSSNKNNKKMSLDFLKDPKNLRYAPIAFDALAATGLFGKSPRPEEYSPTLIQQQGNLTPAQIDEMQLRNAVDSAYKTGVSGLAEASGGSGATLRANLSGLNTDYMSSIGKSYTDVNKANIASKMAADEFNLGMSANTASQNAQAINQAGLYNNQLLNASKQKQYEDRLSYLAKGAEGLGDVGYESRISEIMPKIYGYDQYGNYMPSLKKKACGGRIRLKNRNK